MKRYTLSAADSFTHRPEHPERTARRNCRGVLNFDVMYQVWPNRAAMLKTISLHRDLADTTLEELVEEAEGK